jgi:hypothetical protein
MRGRRVEGSVPSVRVAVYSAGGSKLSCGILGEGIPTRGSDGRYSPVRLKLNGGAGDYRVLSVSRDFGWTIETDPKIIGWLKRTVKVNVFVDTSEPIRRDY